MQFRWTQTRNLASRSTVRLKQQETVSLLSIHSHFTQDSTSSFLDLSWPSCTCLFEYKWLLMAFSSCSWGIFLLIVTHTSKTCVAMSFLLPTLATLPFSVWVIPLRSSQQQVMRSSQETLCPQSQFGWLEQASPLPNKCCTCRENSVLTWSTRSKFSKGTEKFWCPLRSFHWLSVNVQGLNIWLCLGGLLWRTKGKRMWKCKEAWAN